MSPTLSCLSHSVIIRMLLTFYISSLSALSQNSASMHVAVQSGGLEGSLDFDKEHSGRIALSGRMYASFIHMSE